MRRQAQRNAPRRGIDQLGPAESASAQSETTRTDARSKDALLLIVILLFAFGLRFIYITQLQSSPMFDRPTMDERYFDEWAQAIAKGDTYVDGPYYRAPLYSAFTGCIYKVFGHSYLAPRLIQAILGSLGCGLLFLIGRSLFGRPVAAVAGLVAASYWMLIYFDGELLIPSLIVFLDLLLVYLLLRAARAPSVWAYALAGLALGLSALGRPNILLFGPAIVIWMLVRHRPVHRRAWAYVLSVTAGCLLMVLPVTVRNYAVGRDTVLISSQGGWNFYLGNNPLANGRAVTLPGMPGDLWGVYRASTERAEAALGRKLKQSEISRYYFGQGLDFIRREPGRFLVLSCVKVSLFWSWGEISNNKDIYFWTAQFTPLIKWLPIGFGVIGPLGILGLGLCWRRRGELFPLWGFILVYMLGVLLFFCTARFRMPIVPPLILLAVFAVSRIVASVRHASWKSLAVKLAALTLSGMFVHLTLGAGSFRNDANSYVILGNVYNQQGEPERAMESYRKASAIAPGYLTAHYQLGLHHQRAQHWPEAIAELRRALACRPVAVLGESKLTLAGVRYNLAHALSVTGVVPEAVEHYRKCLELDPSGMQGRAHFNLGLLLIQLGRHEQALEALAGAVQPLGASLRLDPDNHAVAGALGRALATLGRYEEALAPLSQGLAADPNNTQLLDDFSSALVHTRGYEQAFELLQRARPLRRPILLNRLAFLLATSPNDSMRDAATGIECLREACPQIGTCGARHLDALAAVLAEMGRFDEAIERARQAVEQARGSPILGEKALAERILERLEQYEAGLPYRLPQP